MTRELREEARRREEERAELSRRREEFARDLRELAARPEGRRFFRWLIEQGDIFAEDYQPGAVGAYRAGLRTFALRLRRIFKENLPPGSFAAVAGESDGGGETGNFENAAEANGFF